MGRNYVKVERERGNTLSTYDGSQSPCDACYKRAMCARQKLACDDLLRWSRKGDNGEYTYPAGRIALSTLYHQLFPGNQELA